MKIGDESILFFSRVFLSKFSLEALFLSWAKGVFILGWEWNVKSQVFQNRAGSRLGLAAWLSYEFQPRGNWTASCPIFSYSAPAGVALQLLACLAHEQLLEACNRESPVRSSHEFLFFLHTLEHFFTLSHSLPLQESHLNTGLLIAKIQVNLAWNKANKMVDKIQPYNFNSRKKKHIERQIGHYILITFVYLSLDFLEKASQGEGVIYIKVVFTRLSKRASQ